MIRPKISRRTVLRLLAWLLSCLLVLAALVIIPLKTHKTPEPDPRLFESRPTPSPEPSLPPEAPPMELRDPNSPMPDEGMQTLLETFVEEHPGCWDIYVYNLSHGDFASVSTEEGKPMVAASLIKLYIMGAVFERVRIGNIPYWDVFGSMRYMIDISDNYCANYLIQRLGDGNTELGFDYINSFALSAGCAHTSIQRTMLDTDSGLENYTSAEDCAVLLKKIYRCELVSSEYSNQMLELLKDQRINDRIPAGLPEGVVCAHKTGDLTNVCCGDAGIVFSPNADYILCVINNGSDNDPQTIEDIASLSASIYEYFNPTPEDGPDAEESAADGEA